MIWEAQFGDFANGAQVIIDQFISSGEAKWGRFCGLTLLLPHGYEGAGPRALLGAPRALPAAVRREQHAGVRALDAGADVPHAAPADACRPFRKPLIVMTPKSLLRHELSVSALEELTRGSFARVIGEVDDLPAQQVERVVFCSGKVYFDLLKARRKEALRDVALVRIEQLYPFPSEEYQAILGRYANASEVVWCQEEPQNQGAWYQIRHRLQELALGQRPVLYAGRAPAAAPATGIAEDPRAGAAGAGRGGAAFDHDRRDRTRYDAPHGAARPCGAEKELMTIEIRVPQLPESVADATLVAWHKQPGEAVASRRESRRPRDRQGGAGSAGARQRRGA